MRVPSLREGAQAAERAAESGETRIWPAPSAPGLTPEMRAQLDVLLRDHGIELRRFVAQSLDQHAGHIISEVRTLLEGATEKGSALAPGSAAAPPPTRSGTAMLWLSAVAATIAVLAGVFWYRAANDAARLGDGTANLSAAVTRTETQQHTLPLSGAAINAMPGVARDAALLVETVPFGESPLSGARIDAVQALLERLKATGFRGTVEIRNYPGRFCLQGTGDTVALPAADLSYSKCDQIGNPVDAGDLAGHESVAFANMLSAERSRSHGAFEVQLAAGSAGEVAVPYPAMVAPLTAGEWNRAAAANNRVEVRAHSQP